MNRRLFCAKPQEIMQSSNCSLSILTAVLTGPQFFNFYINREYTAREYKWCFSNNDEKESPYITFSAEGAALATGFL